MPWGSRQLYDMTIEMISLLVVCKSSNISSNCLKLELFFEDLLPQGYILGIGHCNANIFSESRFLWWLDNFIKIWGYVQLAIWQFIHQLGLKEPLVYILVSWFSQLGYQFDAIFKVLFINLWYHNAIARCVACSFPELSGPNVLLH